MTVTAPSRGPKSYLAARSDAIIRIKQAFDANGITIPFPIRTVELAGGDVDRRQAL